MISSSTADYFAAIDYLINASTDETSHKVTAQFVPQATIHDRIIEIDGMGAKDFDVTFEVLMLGSDQAMDIDNYDILDSFQYAHAAPVWIQTRSEEHTSELQSLMRISYAVFCLKKQTTQHM